MSGRVCALLIVLLAAGCGGDPEPAPAQPRAAAGVDADFAVLVPTSGHAAELPGARTLDPAVARLRGPHFAYSVTAVGRVAGPVPAEVAAGIGLDAGAAPAAGGELLLVDLARTEGEPALLPGQGEELGLEVAGRPVPVPPPGDLTGTIAVSVPAGARPVLRITDAGRTQSLDLRTGRRGPDAVRAYYPVRRGAADTDGQQPTGLRLSGPGVAGQTDRVASVQLDETRAELLPHRVGSGWAKPGRAWLVLDTSFAYGRRSAAGGSPPDTVTAPPSCFRATGPDGSPVRLTGAPVVLGDPAGAPSPGAVARGELVADVPASLREVTVRFGFCGSIRTPDGAASYSVYANPSQTVVITLR